MIRRFLTRVLMVVLIAVCGCNVWQVHQLQGQVAQLQSQVRARTAKGTDQAVEASSPPDHSWLDQADRHAASAKAALLRGDLTDAQRELQRGVNDIHHAVAGPAEKTQATFGQARRTLASLQKEADTLWRKVHTIRPDANP